jgi:two-component system sensor histidine kinase and response regulator WspE
MVLVVDNHSDTREALVRLLRMKGHQATAVSDGAQLLALLGASPLPTLIVLDVNVPRRDGMDLLRTLRTDPRLRGVPVVVFSADDRPRDEALRLGARGYVVKGSLGWEKLSAEIGRYAAAPDLR